MADLKSLSETVTDEDRKTLVTDVVIDNNIVLQPMETLRQQFIVRLERSTTAEEAKAVLEDIDKLQAELSDYDDALAEISSVAADYASGDETNG